MVLEMIRQGGWSGRAKLRGGQESQTKAKALSGCHPSGEQPRQPDVRPECQIKNYSHNDLLIENRA